MKSLQFKKLNISDADVLSKLQMKKISGGHGASNCLAQGSKCYNENNTDYFCISAQSDDECCCGHDAGNDQCLAT